jgi:transposase InsO family protein
MIRSVVLSAQCGSEQRVLSLQRAAAVGGEAGELARLRDENRRLTSENGLLKSRFDAAQHKRRYTPMQRLQILWHMAYYKIPRSRVKEHFRIARSTLYRWLHAAEKGEVGDRQRGKESPRKTPREIAEMIWEIFEANPHFGRHRIAIILGTLGVFLAASTVRNILLRPKPRPAGTPAEAAGKPQEKQPRQIVARYPNHVWSVDRTRVWRWGVWPTWVLVAVDHFSRMVTAVCPLAGPNAGWVTGALEEAFLRHGAPRHIISDQEGVFVSDAFKDLLRRWNVKQRFGAVGKHGSIAVTERMIWTLKYEWLNRVPVIRELDHVAELLTDFEYWYNDCRGHMTLGGAVPSLIHQGEHWQKPERSAKTLPHSIQRRVFSDVRITAYRLAA